MRISDAAVVFVSVRVCGVGHSPLFPGKSDIKDVVYHTDFVVYHELLQRFFGFHIGATDTIRRIMMFK